MYGEGKRYKIVFFLENFKSVNEEIVIINNTKIKKIGEEERFLFENVVGHVLEITVENEGGNWTGVLKRADEKVECIVTALRLLKKSRIHISGGFFVSGAGSAFSHTPEIVGSLLEQLGPVFEIPITTYTLSKREIDELGNICKEYIACDFDRDSELRIAMQRFNKAYCREDMEDKIIDIMVALESLFLKGDEKNELTYRLALRTAAFLGNETTKKDIFKKMKEAYRIRSRIIHGNSANKNLEIKKITEIEDYLRQAIKKLLIMTDRDLSAIIDEIDEGLLSKAQS